MSDASVATADVKRKSLCEWVKDEDGNVIRAADGRPSCAHGPATKAGNRWACTGAVRDRQRKWYESNRDKASAYKRRWDKANPDKARGRSTRKIYVGNVYIGTENSFPVPREVVEAFALQLITQHRADNLRKSVDALAEA